MGRPHRVEVPGGYYHVGTRGNDRRPIYFGDWSGRLFLAELSRASRRHGWQVLAYCLMGNHYHLILRIGDGGLSQGMCELNNRFARLSNWRTRRSDHLFGRRFWSALIDTDEYLLEASRYVLLNPHRSPSAIVDPRTWRWTSLRATLELEHPPAFLDASRLLGWFDPDPRRARVAFARFVRDAR